MIYPSEKRTYRDAKTGREVIQLTSGDSNNVHLYFTDNSFSHGDKEIYFLSDRGNQPNVYNYFKMDLDSGQMTQITHEPNGIGYSTKTGDSEILAYFVGNQVKILNTVTGQTEVVYEEEEDMEFLSPFISPDKQTLGFVRNERVPVVYGNNYSGFKEKMFAIKKGIITLVDLKTKKAVDLFEDTHWLAHFQFAPHRNDLAMFCHEGPWNLVHQRIWLIDTNTGQVKPCFRQEEDDSVGHEFWTRDGLVIFDNRRKGHDGTITIHRTQATIEPVETDQKPYIGFANEEGKVIRTIDMPFYCNHYHANNDNTLLVGDEVDDLVLIDISGEEATIETLCHHGTSWGSQKAHGHPTFSWDCKNILFASDRDGSIHLYMINVEDKL